MPEIVEPMAERDSSLDPETFFLAHRRRVWCARYKAFPNRPLLIRNQDPRRYDEPEPEVERYLADKPEHESERNEKIWKIFKLSLLAIPIFLAFKLQEHKLGPYTAIGAFPFIVFIIGVYLVCGVGFSFICGEGIIILLSFYAFGAVLEACMGVDYAYKFIITPSALIDKRANHLYLAGICLYNGIINPIFIYLIMTRAMAWTKVSNVALIWAGSTLNALPMALLYSYETDSGFTLYSLLHFPEAMVAASFMVEILILNRKKDNCAAYNKKEFPLWMIVQDRLMSLILMFAHKCSMNKEHLMSQIHFTIGITLTEIPYVAMMSQVARFRAFMFCLGTNFSSLLPVFFQICLQGFDIYYRQYINPNIDTEYQASLTGQCSSQ